MNVLSVEVGLRARRPEQAVARAVRRREDDEARGVRRRLAARACAPPAAGSSAVAARPPRRRFRRVKRSGFEFMLVSSPSLRVRGAIPEGIGLGHRHHQLDQVAARRPERVLQRRSASNRPGPPRCARPRSGTTASPRSRAPDRCAASFVGQLAHAGERAVERRRRRSRRSLPDDVDGRAVLGRPVLADGVEALEREPDRIHQLVAAVAAARRPSRAP